jgi:haloalkane dehalogenase
VDLLRTPDERFESLAGYPFEPHYLSAGGVRIHYIDEGPPGGEPVLMLHGEPSWSYLYRKMVPVFAGAGLRAIAPDLPGFGRSDKLAKRADYTYERHVEWMKGLIEGLDLHNINLVCQDWGGLIGLRLAAENEDRFARIVAANTFLPTGDMPAGEAFLNWKRLSQEIPMFDVGRIVNGGCVTDLSQDVIAAYDAPFPDETYKEGARQFPNIVPITPDDPASAPNRKAWEVLGSWIKPFLTAFSDSDPITRGADLFLQQAIPGAKGQPHTTIVGAGHFLQEDRGEELARAALDFIRTT